MAFTYYGNDGFFQTYVGYYNYGLRKILSKLEKWTTFKA